MRTDAWVLMAAGLAAIAGCDADGPLAQQGDPAATAGPAMAVEAVARPFQGVCHLTVTARVHEDSGGCGGEDESGGCSGDDGGCGGEDEGGGPPIPRHFNVSGSCTLTHLGLSQVTGRLNLSGPFGAEGEGEEGGHGTLGARGRLTFVAANGDQLVGRYIPVQAAFTRAGEDGGTVVFTSTEQFNTKCSDPGGGPGGEHEAEDSSTGRFTGATGESPLSGDLRILRSGSGSGTIVFNGGTLAY